MSGIAQFGLLNILRTRQTNGGQESKINLGLWGISSASG